MDPADLASIAAPAPSPGALELDFASATAGVAAFALVLSLLSRCLTARASRPSPPALHLQEQLMDESLQASFLQDEVLLPPTKLLSSALAALAYLLALSEALQLWLDEVSWPTASRLGAFLLLGIISELEAGGAPQVGARRQSPLLWRCRAALRSLCAAALCVAHVEPLLNWLAHVETQSPADEAPWELDALAAAAAGLALGHAWAMCAGPPLLKAVSTPPPPNRVAWLIPKLLFFYWLPQVWRLRRLANTRTDEPVGVADLPSLPPSISSAKAWAAGAERRKRFRSPRPGEREDDGLVRPMDLVVRASRLKAAAKARRASLLSEMWAVSRLDATLQFVWCLGVLLAEYAAPFGMMGLISYIGANEDGPIPPHAIGYGVMVAIGPLMVCMCHGQANVSGWAFGTTLRAYLTRAVCEKSLAFDMSATEQSTGQLTNLLAVDAFNIVNFAGMSAWLWLEGLQLVTTLAALYYLLGIAALGGLGVCLLAFPLNTVVMRQVKKLQEKLMKQKDKRMALLSEAVGAIRAIKLHAWEDEFETRIARQRAKEVRTLLSFQKLNAITSTMWLTTPTTAALASFLIKSRLLPPYRITAAQGFTALTLFQLLSVSLTFLPYVINSAIQANVGLRRISRYLALDDVDGRDDGQGLHLATGAVLVRDASFSWKQPPPSDDQPESPRPKSGSARGGKKPTAPQRPAASEATTAPLLAPTPPQASLADDVASDAVPTTASAPLHTLTGFDLSVSPGTLTIICGPTGCGKSSLLAALLGDCPRVGGRAALSGRVSYCPQRAWLSNATLRENIVFGAPFDQARYDRVLDACALGSDLALLPAGDATEIGERGVNLSGGQQQRVNLARACYADSDIVVLDDVLSAVDAHVGAHIYEACILGLLAGRTRLLVTHAVALTISRADQVVVLEAGRLAAKGPPDSEAPEIQALARQAVSQPSSRAGSRAASAVDLAKMSGSPQVARRDAAADAPPASATAQAAAVQASAAAVQASAAATSTSTAGAAPAGGITKDEERSKGAAKLSAYLFYLRAAGGLPFAAAFTCLLMVYSSMNPLQSIALRNWMHSMEGDGATGQPALLACGVYTAAALGLIAITGCRNVILPYASVAASRKLHGGMMKSVMRAPISWFEATPTGRVLNRFSSDISAIDQQVASQFKDVAVFAFNVVGISLVCSLGSGQETSSLVVLAAVGVASFFSWAIYSIYRVAAREQKRLESITKSPLLAFFGELISGAAVARAFGGQRRMVQMAESRVDDANRALFYLQAQTNQWLRLSMNLVGSVVTSAVVTVVLWQRHNLSGGDAGLTLSYSTQFVGAVSALLNLKTILEISMNDVERIDEYTNGLPAEEYGDAAPSAAEGRGAGLEPLAIADGNAALDESWPKHGAIEFRDVSLKYATAAAPVYAGLSFTVPARTRVGVVGRTGAGKSSLAVALFRVVELSSGSILIDGVDARRVPLRRLRSSLSIIQQDPTLFQGTVRYNLAPVSEHDDAELWEALRRAGLDSKIEAMANGLDADVSEGGSNLSAGERQLLCMARAMLRRRPVLVMDEATASVDHATDARIQQMVKRDFRGNTTVLTIAHRLHTVAFYDRILLLGGGAVQEYDMPLALMSKDGPFRQLAEESGDFESLLAAAKAEEAAGETGGE